MNKTTLSSYGWIVITTLVLAVMLALSTPFGNYIGNAVKTALNGFINTGDKAIEVVIPENKNESEIPPFNTDEPITPDIPENDPEVEVVPPTVNARIQFGKKYSLTQDCGCTMEAMFFEDGTFLGFINNIFNAGYYQRAIYDWENGKITIDGLTHKYFTLDENDALTLHQDGETPLSTEMTLIEDSAITFVSSIQHNVIYRYETPQEIIDLALQENVQYLKHIDFVYEENISEDEEVKIFRYEELYLNPEETITEDLYESDIGTFINGMFIDENGKILAIFILDGDAQKPQLHMDDRIFNEII